MEARPGIYAWSDQAFRHGDRAPYTPRNVFEESCPLPGPEQVAAQHLFPTLDPPVRWVASVSNPYRVTVSPDAARQLAGLSPRRRAGLEARLTRRLAELAAYASARQWTAPEEVEDGFRTSLPGQTGVVAHYALNHVSRTLILQQLEGLGG